MLEIYQEAVHDLLRAPTEVGHSQGSLFPAQTSLQLFVATAQHDSNQKQCYQLTFSAHAWHLPVCREYIHGVSTYVNLPCTAHHTPRTLFPTWSAVSQGCIRSQLLHCWCCPQLRDTSFTGRFQLSCMTAGRPLLQQPHTPWHPELCFLGPRLSCARLFARESGPGSHFTSPQRTPR